MILHTSVPFGIQHIDLTVPEAEPILKEVDALCFKMLEIIFLILHLILHFD